jgi:MoxR-like ATPase
VLLLIDEVDRVEIETEALLLEILSEWQVSIPELGTVRAVTPPFVVLTSNNTRELSEALKRRCLFLHMDYPTIERETAILRARVPEIDAQFAEQIARVVSSIRGLELKKPPSISETLDWARTLQLLGIKHADSGVVRETLPLLLKYQQDIERVSAQGAAG